MSEASLLYVSTPLSAWCHAFNPVLDRLLHRCGERLHLRLLVVPCLDASLLSNSLLETLEAEWRAASAHCQSPLDTGILSREGFCCDDTLPARAVATAALLHPGLEYPFLKGLQRAFFEHGHDITQPEAYRGLLAEFGLEAQPFMDTLLSDRSQAALQKAAEEARRYQISSFPTLMLHRADFYHVLSQDYEAYDALEPMVTEWLEVNV